ncbi:outer membrane beta-barrel family protein [Pedobacter nutrimenti]|uniref:outer membrane beta-barrel family protein n=1 Tax=Pedobacter nutrimenti TaxID=1241337 RepID=UPI0014761E26|nr:outer membrane beta-barrel family protein [Pedobacter nutrimenti]
MDKKLIKVEYINDSGIFSFDRIPTGRYTLTSQSMSFTKYESGLITLDKNTDLGNINLAPLHHTLKEVSISAIKPFIQQQYDKTVLNVAGSISSTGSTALEVLEKAPGITIDQNDNISMRGRKGVLVMIDGKLVPMSGQDLANMLRSMSASQIEKIDMITNPSSKYDASGNSGIIDIRLKKGKNEGLNGNVIMSYGQGAYSKFNPSLNLNAKHKKLNVFLSYNYNRRNDFTKLISFRNFYDSNDQVTGGNNYNNYFTYKFDNHNARLGADYNITPNIIIGFAANGLFTNGDILSDSKASSVTAQQQPTGFFNTMGDIQRSQKNSSINLNYRHILDTLGKELNADLDYARYDNGELQNYNTQYFDTNQNQSKTPYVLFGDLNGKLDIKSFKIDYVHPIKPLGVKLEAGIKSSWVKSDNDVMFFDRSTGKNILDPGKSNHFIYKENINAAYLNASKRWAKLSMQIGLRLENTITNGFQTINQNQFDRNYTQLFPSGYIGYALNKQHDLGISASRRIDRPTYRQLNPFKVFLDPLTSAAGNPFLNPEITNSFELTHTFKQKFITKIGYSQTRDNILTILSPDTEPNSVIQTGRNLAKYNYYNLSFTFPLNLGTWLNSSNTALAYYGNYSGNLLNTKLDQGQVCFNFNSSNSILINNNTSMELIGSYQTKSNYGFMAVDGVWFVNIGVQKQLWNKKVFLKFNLSDAFYTNKTSASTKLTGYSEHFTVRRDTRTGTLSLSYKFGGNGSSTKRKTGGADEEKRRAG